MIASIMVHWSLILGQGWLLSNHKHVKTVFIQVLSYITQSSADALIVALLWKLPQIMPISSKLVKTNFDMFYKIDFCAAIHGQIWMNNVPT